MASRFEGDVQFAGDIIFLKSATLPDASVDADTIKPGANLKADDLQHRRTVSYGQKDGATVVSETQVVFIAAKSGTVKRIEVRPTTAPSGGDLKYTVDVQKAANGSGTWTSLLSSPITVDSSASSNTKITGTLIASPTLSAGDAVRVVITTSGSTGTQGQGLAVNIDVDEDGT